MAEYPLIHGQRAMSWNEVYIARALDRLKIDYTFQAAPFGYSLRGSFIIDFVVYNPFPTPVEIFGEHWHTGELGSDDQFRLAIIRKKYGREVVVIWGAESDTQEHADEAVRRKIA